MIWAVELDAPHIATADTACWLDEDELRRYRGFLNRHCARRFAIAHIALRGLLAASMSATPAGIRFKRTEFGRPFVEGGPAFSLSHSAGFALIAFSEARHFAVDLESLASSEGLLPFHDILSHAEVRRCFGSMPHDEFLRLWVRKEAVAKALGQGLMQPFSDIALSRRPSADHRTRLALVRNEGRLQFFRCYDVALNDYAACLVSDDALDRPLLHFLDAGVWAALRRRWYAGDVSRAKE